MPLLRDLADNGRLLLRGDDRARFLHGMVTNDVQRLHPGEGCRAAMLTIKGKLLGELCVYCEAEALLVDVAARGAVKVREALERHIIMDDVTVEDQGALGEVALLGEEAWARASALLGPLPPLPPLAHLRRGDLHVAGTWELGRPGVRLRGDLSALLPRLELPLLSVAEEEVLRVEAGEPRYGVDMGEDHLPIESRLDDTISFSKGCYLGQEVIVRATQQGRINRRLMGLRLDGEGAAAPGSKVEGEERPQAGYVTSAVVSPRHGSIALAYLHRTVWEVGRVLTVVDGERRRRAVVSELPFG